MTDDLIRQYLRAAARLYGRIRLYTLYCIFTHHNGGKISAETFYARAREAEAPYETFRIIGDDDIYRADISVPDMDRWVVHRQYCYAIWDEFFTLERNHEGKRIRMFSKEQMLSYADPTYIPQTPQVCELGQVIQSFSDGRLPQPQILQLALALAENDYNAAVFLRQMEQMGCRFATDRDRRRAVHCYKQVYDTVPKSVHNGNSEEELRTVLKLPDPLKRYYLWFCPPTRKETFYEKVRWMEAELPTTEGAQFQRFMERCLQAQTLPPRLFAPCHCGSGLYYADCCGKR